MWVVQNMDELPSEIILHVATFLSPLEIINLQLVSRRLFNLARDNNLWRVQCFADSPWEKVRRKRAFVDHRPVEPSSLLRDLQRALIPGRSTGAQLVPKTETRDRRPQTNERTRILANWDPSYPDEKVDWYSEYVHRSAPITVNWLEQPRYRERNGQEPMEIRGAGVYNPSGDDQISMVVGPLDDGSVCLWDVSSPSGKRGRIIARSAAHTLSVSGPTSAALRSKMIHTGVTECVSVNTHFKRAYIAVQSNLLELDLETLQVVSQERFPFSISVISEAKSNTPITVGTNLSLHLHDPRATLSYPSTSDFREQQVEGTLIPRSPRSPNIQPVNYAPLFHPGPLSIAHIPAYGSGSDVTGNIYVAGRFSSILNYDRRCFPKLCNTIHSGARLCSITSIPYLFEAQLKDRMRHAELSLEQLEAAKSLPGSTLIACGEYNSKGSLELYGLPPELSLEAASLDLPMHRSHSSNFLRNRQTSSDSKLLTVSSHGTRIVFSDGGGNMKWIERDGFTGVREWNVNQGSVDTPEGIFGVQHAGSGSGDIVRKVLHTKSASDRNEVPVDKDDLVLWTGERLGLLSFSNKAEFSADTFEGKAKTAEEEMREREERLYGENMKKALKRQADEVRFVRGLGLGFG